MGLISRTISLPFRVVRGAARMVGIAPSRRRRRGRRRHKGRKR